MADDNKTGTAAASSEGTAGSTSTDTAATKTGEQTGTGGTTTEQKTGDGEAGKQPEGKTTEQQQKDQGGKPGGKEGTIASPKAPEKYALQVPDAAKPYVDPSYLATVEKMAREGDLTNDEAQAYLEDSIAHVTMQANAWAEQTKADPDYGGQKLEETQRLAKRVIDRVRPEGHARRDSFNNFLARGGAGNHIEVVSFLADLGRMMGEDSPAHGRSNSGGGDPAQQKASKLYDHPDSKRADGRA